MASPKRHRNRVIEFLRKQYPGTWKYIPGSIHWWESATHEAHLESFIVDADNEIFGTGLRVYKKDGYEQEVLDDWPNFRVRPPQESFCHADPRRNLFGNYFEPDPLSKKRARSNST